MCLIFAVKLLFLFTGHVSERESGHFRLLGFGLFFFFDRKRNESEKCFLSYEVSGSDRSAQAAVVLHLSPSLHIVFIAFEAIESFRIGGKLQIMFYFLFFIFYKRKMPPAFPFMGFAGRTRPS